MEFNVNITDEEMQGYVKSIVRDKIKASISQRLSSMMSSYGVEQEMRDQLYKALKKSSDTLIPKLLEDQARMTEVAQEAVTKHMMAKIKRNIKKMEQS